MQHILNRANTYKVMSQKLRSPAPSDGGSGTPELNESTTSARTSFEPTIARAESSDANVKDKK